ncbi:MAG: hypothetical protein ABI537_12765 [Casimicrobiaceae bacterium]
MLDANNAWRYYPTAQRFVRAYEKYDPYVHLRIRSHCGDRGELRNHRAAALVPRLAHSSGDRDP